MGKSLGNAYTVNDIKDRGVSPLALRYFYLTGHYRRQLNFTWEALKAAQTALTKLREVVRGLKSDQTDRTSLSEEKRQKIDDFQSRFRGAIEDDLNLPEAVAVVWELTKSNVSNYDKLDLLREFDQVLGLGLEQTEPMREKEEIPAEIEQLVGQREELRKKRNYPEADQLRIRIEELGYKLEDRGGKTRAVKND